VQVSQDVWAGIDAGKIAHHCVVIDAEGTKLLSRKVSNDEADLLGLIDDVGQVADGGRICWAADTAVMSPSRERGCAAEYFNSR
jgi:hypothetical protein